VHTPAPETSRAPCSTQPSTCGKGKHCHCPPMVAEEDDFLNSSPPTSMAKGKGKGPTAQAPPPPRTPTPPPSESDSETEDEPVHLAQPTPGPSQPRRSEQEPKPRYKEGSVYGKKSGAQVDKMSTCKWWKVVRELSSTPRKVVRRPGCTKNQRQLEMFPPRFQRENHRPWTSLNQRMMSQRLK
jgi:hypothetical protein